MKRLRQKSCDLCQKPADVMYRIQTDLSGVWHLVCPECRQYAAERPQYRYGGTWKAVKRH